MPTVNEQVAQEPVIDQTPASEEQVVNVDTSSDETQAAKPEGAESATAAIVEPETNANDDEAPRRNRAQERIEDLVAERNAAKEYAEYLMELNRSLITQTRTSPTQAQATREAEPQQLPALPPTLEEFGYDQKAHAEATAAWYDARVQVGVRQALEGHKQEATQQAITSAFEQRIEQFKESHPDFDMVMANPKLPQLDRLAAVMIVNSDHGADISYKLAKNPDLAVRISRMSAPQQALAIGRLEAEVQKAAEPAPQPVTTTPTKVAPPKVTTKAPAPPEPIPAGGAPSVDPSGMSVKEWMENRRIEARNRRRR